MFLVNISNPGVLLLALFLTICFIYIGKGAKNAYVNLVPLVVFLILLLMHSVQVLSLPAGNEEMIPLLAKCLSVDFIMILISYLAYLWVDDIEAKAKKKKSIDNSLEWLWKKV